MKVSSRFVEALRKIPLVFYVLSFIIILILLVFGPENTTIKDLDKFVYRSNNEKCLPVVVLMDYDFRQEYFQNIDSLTNADSLSTPYQMLEANAKVKVVYSMNNLHKIHFLLDSAIADGFVLKEYVKIDSCFVPSELAVNPF